MEREKITGPAGNIPAGTTVLILRGPNGAVTLSAWKHESGVVMDLGVLGIHYKTPMHEDQRPCPCEYLPEGSCFADTSYTVGQDEAPNILAGYDSAAWVTLLHFYKQRIDPDGADHG